MKEGEKEKETQKKTVKRVDSLKATNLLMTRKKCEKKTITIDDIVKTDSRILSFGQFISGQNLGNVIEVTNKTNMKQTFQFEIDQRNEKYQKCSKDLLRDFY